MKKGEGRAGRSEVGMQRRGVYDCWGAVEDGEAYYFGFCDVGAVGEAAWGEEKCSGGVGDAGFLPFAGQEVNGFVRVGMNVRGDGHAGVKFAEDGYAAGFVILVEEHQFDAGIGAGLPGFVFRGGDVWEHALRLMSNV